MFESIGNCMGCVSRFYVMAELPQAYSRIHAERNKCIPVSLNHKIFQ